jgi:hypothetical protein
VTVTLLGMAECVSSVRFASLAAPVMSVALQAVMEVESNTFFLEIPWKLNFLSPPKLPR